MTEAICRHCSTPLRIGTTEDGPRYFSEQARADGGHVLIGRAMWRVFPDGTEIKPGQWAIHESTAHGGAIRFALHDDVCGKPETAPPAPGTATRPTGVWNRGDR